MQRADDPRAFQRFALAIFVAQCHQARHFGLSDVEFLAAIGGEGDVFYGIVFGQGGYLLLNKEVVLAASQMREGFISGISWPMPANVKP